MRLDRVAVAMAQAWLLRDGPATTLPLGLVAFLKSEPDLEAPDIEFLIGGATVRGHIPGFRV